MSYKAVSWLPVPIARKDGREVRGKIFVGGGGGAVYEGLGCNKFFYVVHSVAVRIRDPRSWIRGLGSEILD
jgi:hypothetical protein